MVDENQLLWGLEEFGADFTLDTLGVIPSISRV